VASVVFVAVEMNINFNEVDADRLSGSQHREVVAVPVGTYHQA
jgi:hypothetical protein